jgi:glucose-induced degradation protein 8
LDTNPALYFHLHQQRLIELIRQGNVTEALHFAQEELAPRGEENTEFLAELENTMALLAFDASSSNTTNTPRKVAELLLPEQRQKTANEVNTAILESLNQNKEAKLIGLVRLLVWGENILAEKANFPKVVTLLKKVLRQIFQFRL